MDKLKESLGPVAKHAFWIACGAIVLIGLITWFLAKGSLSKQTATNMATIKAAFSGAESTARAGVSASGSGSNVHPNDETHKQTEEIIRRFKLETAKAWAMQYNNQKEVLVWPQVDDKFNREVTLKLQVPKWEFEDVNGAYELVEAKSVDEAVKILKEKYPNPEEEIDWDTLKASATYKPINLPIESAVPFPTDREDEYDPTIREMYAQFLPRYLATLPKRIGATWKPSSGGGMASGFDAISSGAGGPDMGAGGSGGIQDDSQIVVWDEKNQAAWQQRLTVYPGRKQQGNVPTTLQMLYAQEDLWILESILDVIQETNVNAALAEANDEPENMVLTNYTAAIKTITNIDIGADARNLGGKLTPVGSGFGEAPAAAGGMSGGGFDDMGGGGPMPSSGMEPDGGSGDGFSSGTTQTAAVPDPADKRYIDNAYEPLDAAKLRSAFDPNQKSSETVYLSVAKRMPVRLGLVMSQKEIPRFLAECANSSLPFEVRQVRINPSAVGSNSSGDANMGTFGSEADGGFPLPGGSPTQGTGPKTSAMPVEVYGVIYIYNPPMTEKLAIEELERPASDTTDTPEVTEPEPVLPTPEPAADAGKEPEPPAS